MHVFGLALRVRLREPSGKIQDCAAAGAYLACFASCRHSPPGNDMQQAAIAPFPVRGAGSVSTARSRTSHREADVRDRALRGTEILELE